MNHPILATALYPFYYTFIADEIFQIMEDIPKPEMIFRHRKNRVVVFLEEVYVVHKRKRPGVNHEKRKLYDGCH